MGGIESGLALSCSAETRPTGEARIGWAYCLEALVGPVGEGCCAWARVCCDICLADGLREGRPVAMLIFYPADGGRGDEGTGNAGSGKRKMLDSVDTGYQLFRKIMRKAGI